MDLKTYLNTLTSKQRKEFAETSATTVNMLWQLAYKNKPFTVQMALNLDYGSRGALRAEELCPEKAHLFEHLRKPKRPT